MLIKETYKRTTQNETGTVRRKPLLNINNDLIELHLIQLMMEYPQKIIQVENGKILDYFLQPEIQKLGKKIIDAYNLLGFIDVGVILSVDVNPALREKIFQLMIKALPADDMMLGRIFNDNVLQLKRRWYKEQHRQIKIKLSKAQETGNEDMISNLLYEKESILKKEKELNYID